MPQVHVEMTSEDAKVWASLQRLTQGLGQVEGGLSKTGKKAREAAKEHAALERAAKKVWKENATPLERYKAKMAELEKTLGKAGVTQAHLARATAKAKAEFQQETASLQASSKAGQAAAQKQRELALATERATVAAGKVWKENASPLERYKAKLAELKTTLGKAGVTQEHLAKATAKARAEFDQQTAAMQAATAQGQAAAQRQRDLATATERATQKQRDLGRAAKQVWREGQTPLERYTRRVRELDVMLKRTGMTQETYRRAVGRARAELNASAAAGRTAHGPSALASVGRMAAAYLSLSRAIYAGVAGLREMDEARQTAAQRQLESKQTLGSLTQLVESDEGVARLVRLSKQIYAHGGGETLDQAGRVAFSLQSAGLQDSARIFTDMKSTGVVDQPDVMARAVKTMISSFGTEEAGSVNQILSKAFAASKFNPAEVEPLLEAASGAGSFARALKISDEEVLAATALQAEEVGTPSGGGTRVAALLRQIGKITEEGTGEASFEGMDLKEIITEIGRVAPTPGKLTDLLGERSESLAAFRGLQLKMEEYDKVLAEIKRLQDADTAAQKVAMARRIPEVRAAELQNIGRARKELGETDFGVTRNLTDAMIDGAKRLAKERRDQTGGGRWAEFKDAMRFKFVEAARLVQGDEAVLRDVAPRIPELELGDEVRRNLNRIDRQRTGPGGAGDRWDWSARPEIPKEPAPKPVAEDLAPSASTSAPTSASKPTASHQDTSAAESLAAMREMVGLLNAGNTHLEGIKEASRQPTLSDPGRDH